MFVLCVNSHYVSDALFNVFNQTDTHTKQTCIQQETWKHHLHSTNRTLHNFNLFNTAWNIDEVL